MAAKLPATTGTPAVGCAGLRMEPSYLATGAHSPRGLPTSRQAIPSSLKGVAYQPAELVVKRGDTVVWVNMTRSRTP